MLVILTLGTACDNVEWGGMEVSLQAPPPARVGAPEPDGESSLDDVGPVLPRAPVLYMGYRDLDGSRLVPVGEIGMDTIISLPSERESPGFRALFVRSLLAPGTEFVIFAEGVRAGRFTAVSVETDEGFCTPRPTVRGVVELIPEAAAATRFLALPIEHASSVAFREYRSLEDELAHRQASLNQAAAVLRDHPVAWPPTLSQGRVDMKVFQPGGDGPESFATTYLFQDRLSVSQPIDSAGWSLFVIGIDRGGAYEPGAAWFRAVREEGKGAARFHEQLDWDGDGDAEVLLEVLGDTHRWPAVLEWREGGWERSYEDPCGASAAGPEDPEG